MYALWRALKEARKKAGLTQQDVADACHVSRAAVAQWESQNPEKRTRPTYENLTTFAQLADIQVGELLADDVLPDTKRQQSVYLPTYLARIARAIADAPPEKIEEVLRVLGIDPSDKA